MLFKKNTPNVTHDLTDNAGLIRVREGISNMDAEQLTPFFLKQAASIEEGVAQPCLC